MKKNLLVFTAILLVAFTGCNKDDEEKAVATLEGTTWEYFEKDSMFEGKTTTQFGNGTFTYSGYEIMNEGDTANFSGTGFYTYIPPVVTIYEKEEIGAAVIAGDSMSIMQKEGADPFVYIRKK